MLGRTERARLAARVAAVVAGAVLAIGVAPSRGHALTMGYYEMCEEGGRANQATPIVDGGHTAVDVESLTPADLAPLDVLFVNNCSNDVYAMEYLDHLGDVEDAVADGLILVVHDRWVEEAETILPGGSGIDIRRHVDDNGQREIQVADGGTLLVNGPGGTITDTNLDNGTSSNHGYTVASTIPSNGRVILTRDDPTRVVNFVYGFGAGVVLYSTIPLDHYLGQSFNIGPVLNTIYAPNAVAYAAALATSSCGNGTLDGGEACDAGLATIDPTCCTFDCTLRAAGDACRGAADLCDVAELCDGVSAVCPGDAVEAAGTTCASSSGAACDVDDTCDGVSVACADAVATSATVCRGAVSDCDVAETCDGVGTLCPADAVEPAGTACADDGDLCTTDLCDGASVCTHTAKPDGDVDGTCDEQDACTNVGGLQDFATAPKSVVRLTRINTDTVPGNDGLRLTGEFQLAPGSSFASFDPIGEGARVVIESAALETRVDQALPGGAHGGRGTRGWKRNRSGTMWTYTDSTTAPLSGIKRMTVVDKSSKAPRRVRVVVTGVKGTYPVVAADAPIEAIVVLGAQGAAQAGACGESAYGVPSCAFNVKGDTLTCRR